MCYLFRVPVITLTVYRCLDKIGLAGVQEKNVIIPGKSKRSAMLNFYKIHKLAKKKRPKIGRSGMLWINREEKIKRICSDSLLKRIGKDKYICNDGTGKCPVIGNGIIEGSEHCLSGIDLSGIDLSKFRPIFKKGCCPMIDTYD